MKQGVFMSLFKLNKIVASLLSMGLSQLAFANGVSHESYPAPVHERNLPWHVVAEALWLQPTITNLNYARDFHDDNNGNEYTREKAIDPDYHFAFRLEAGYHIPHTRNDLTVNWLHLNGNDSASARAAPDHILAVRGVGEGEFQFAHSSINQSFDAVNLEYGHTKRYASGWTVRGHGGLEYARIYSDQKINGVFFENSVLERLKNKSTFNGIGPRFGIDANYALGNGFSLVGKAAGTLLVGNLDVKVTDRIESESANFTGASKRTVVPGAEGKLGLSYENDLGNGILTIEGGYYVAGYYQSVRSAFGSEGGEGLFTTGTCSCIGNFGMNGPYLGAKFRG